MDEGAEEIIRHFANSLNKIPSETMEEVLLTIDEIYGELISKVVRDNGTHLISDGIGLLGMLQSMLLKIIYDEYNIEDPQTALEMLIEGSNLYRDALLHNMRQSVKVNQINKDLIKNIGLN